MIKSIIKKMGKFKTVSGVMIIFTTLFWTGFPSFGEDKVKIEYFGREDCKNCANLEKFLKELSTERNDFTYVEYKIDKDVQNRKFFNETTDKLKLVKGTPIIYVNERVIQGYNTADTTGKEIVKEINKGKKKESIPTLIEFMEKGNFSSVAKDGAVCEIDGVCEVPGAVGTYNKQIIVNIPFINKTIDLSNYSLPLMAAVLGTIDGFNPCAMWVLVLFLTALVAVGNKVKMFRVAGLFIFAEAVMYYLILNVWLYTWDFVGLDKWITPAVGIIGIIGGIFFMRNFLKKGNELSCEVTDFKKRAEISGKIRNIADKPFTFLTVLGIIGLALSVNVIEFACSVGIPQTFTKILQINNISFVQKHLYTFIYILGYMIDDFIVFGFALLSVNKLQLTSKYSKWMNLFGGILMIILGLILLLKPSLLVL
ncbi:glutaredoxin [Leptotrichia sp. OH3620_COT-345]|uniref:glutaredoxin n=1 Tax=Leptotrichia sp. OH3620_COT-345 TaxID=2491048 RepID=UPI000F646FD6|nr:glutaredoxin [Leptotrichia sp. OH3620_COT-345]RRD40615.1 glutaredoxin [Leptotrichia sp. OH3620_COT-345]